MPTILIVAASPSDKARLRLGAEVRDIRHALQRSRNRECWDIQSNEAATVDDLRRALLDFRPVVLHFAGHGRGQGGLCFEDANGETHSTQSKPLARLLHHFKDSMKCVVLNACFSEEQGEEIRQEINNVIGMGSSVDDRAACKFAVAFYDAVFAGTDFRTAFDLACTALDLNNIPDADVPTFMTSPHLDIPSLSYNANVPEIERVLYAYLNTPYTNRWIMTTTGISLSESMAMHYSELFLHPVERVQVRAMRQIGPEHWYASVKVVTGEDNYIGEFYLWIRDRTVLIEWEATVGLWSIPVMTYLAIPPKEPVVARVSAIINNHYSYDLKDAKWKYQSIALYSRQEIRLNAYIERNTDDYNRLIKILLDGNIHLVTLEIRNVTDESDIHLITKFLSDTWLYSEKENLGY